MKGHALATCLLGLGIFLVAAGVAVASSRPAAALETGASSGLLFVENVGQFADGARFQLRGGRATVWLADDAIWITLLEPATKAHTDDPMGGRYPLPDPADDAPRRGVNVRLSFVGANPSPTLEPFDPLTTTVSYFLSNDPDKWRPAVPVWGGVRYAGLYPGLDLELAGRDGELALQMVCRAADCEAALEQVQLQVDGADEVALEDEALRIETAVGDVRLPLLEVVDPAGRPVELDGTLTTVAGATVSSPFTPGSSLLPPVPSPKSPADDPADLLYSTYLGGSDDEDGNRIVVDDAGNAYVTGITYSLGFPTTPGALDTTFNGGSDGYVVKLNAAGNALVYATYLGGNDLDGTIGIALDGTSGAYVTGATYSDDFPATQGAYDTTHNGDLDAFVAHLSSNGDELIYATYLGGTDEDLGSPIILDGAGNAYVSGYTFSADFPTTAGALDETFNGALDTFVVKISPGGDQLAYATFIGGSGWDNGTGGLVLSNDGDLLVAGSTDSVDFPTTVGAFDTSFNGWNDAFVAKLDLTDNALSFATFLGGSGYDSVRGAEFDSEGNAIVAGVTSSNNFPTTPGSFDTSHNGLLDIFVAKLNPAGADLIYATFIGGANFEDNDETVVLGQAGNVYLTGYTESSDFPTTPGAFDTTHNGGRDAFVASLNAAGSELSYATFIGGADDDEGWSVAVDSAGNTYVVGRTGSGNFPTTPEAFDTTFNGNFDAFITKLAARLVHADFDGQPRADLPPLNVTFTNLSSGEFDSCAWDFGDGGGATTCETVAHLYDTAGVYTVTLTISGTLGMDTEIRPGYITVYEAVAAGFAATPTAGIAPLVVSFDNQSTGSFDTCLWDFGDGAGSPACDDPTHEYGAAGVYTVSLTVSGPGGTDIQIQPDLITVYEPVAADFTAEPTEGVAPLEVTFDNLSAGDFDTCLWDFGDGGTSTACGDPVYTYPAAGLYTVALTVSGLGGIDTLTRTDYIAVYEPAMADFTAEPTAGTAPLEVQFANVSNGDFEICLWTFGDGFDSSDCEDPTHEYAVPGVYTVSLTVSGLGGTDTLIQPDLITVHEPVAAEFSATPTTGIAPLLVAFDNESVGDYNLCFWAFGDGATSMDCTDPQHEYAAGGVYTVTLEVVGLGGSDLEIKPGYITVYESVAAAFSAEPTAGLAPLNVAFANLSTGDFDSCLWEFGDGGTSEACGEAKHLYVAPGVYTVTLTVSGPGGTDSLVREGYIIVEAASYAIFIPVALRPE